MKYLIFCFFCFIAFSCASPQKFINKNTFNFEIRQLNFEGNDANSKTEVLVTNETTEINADSEIESPIISFQKNIQKPKKSKNSTFPEIKNDKLLENINPFTTLKTSKEKLLASSTFLNPNQEKPKIENGAKLSLIFSLLGYLIVA